MTKGIKCDGPDCVKFIVGEPSSFDLEWYQLVKVDAGEYSYHFHNLDCLINWAKLEKEVDGDRDE